MAELLKKDVLKWIKALKSGEYKKGSGALVSKDYTKFCCLGVWADLHGAVWEDGDGITNKTPVPISRGRKNPFKKQRDSLLLDPKLRCGLSGYEQRHLAELNDTSKTFVSVIKYIEENIFPIAK